MKATIRNRLLQAAAALVIGGAGGVATHLAVHQPSPEVRLAMELGQHFESSGRHIGKPYRDVIGKGQPWTVCAGVTGAGVVPGKTYTEADCYALELPRYQQAEADARALFTRWDSYNVWQRASLIDMAYNLGAPALRGSTLQAKANAGDLAGACEQMTRWVYGTVGGVKTRLAGLVDRRDTTRELCTEWGRDGHFSAAAVAALTAQEGKK